VVFVPPGPSARVVGREACLESFRDFLRQARVDDYRETDRRVEVFGATAVATYRFEMRYEMKGESYRDAGSDVFVFTREEDSWLAVWRTMIPDETAPPVEVPG
jgi:hypothetical protein